MNKRTAITKFITITLVALFLVMVPLSTVKAASTIYVRPYGDNIQCNGTGNQDYSIEVAPNCAVLTIQQGITLVDAGGTVDVASGTYDGEITINKSLALIGDPGDASAGPGGSVAIIDGGSVPGDAIFIGNGVTNVTIKGFEIRNFTSNDTGIGNGISAWEASTSTITIQDNYFHDLGYNGVLVGNDDALGDHTNWLIKSNIVDNVGYIGFELTNTSNSSIESNIIHLDNPDIGAIFSSTRRANESGLKIINNEIDGTPSTAFPVIYLYAYDLDVTGPHLDDVLIEGNIISTTGTPAQIYIRNIGTGTITGVDVHHNSIKSLRNTTAQPIDASCNWWTELSGPTLVANPGGTGGTITGASIFAPWLIYSTDGNAATGWQLPTSFTVLPPGENSEALNDFTTLDNAIGCAVDGQTIDINGPYTWATANPLANAAYLASYADTDNGDIRGLEIPEGVDDLTITSSLGTGHILGAGDVDDSSTLIFSTFLFSEDAPGNDNLTIENLEIEDFEGAITLGWNSVGSFNGTMIQDNEVVLAGDNSDDSDWIQNIAFYFWMGTNQTLQNNTVTFQADGLHTGTYTSASFGYQSGTSGSGYDGLVLDGNTFQVGDTSTGTEVVFGIWENSHSDDNSSDLAITNNKFLGKSGDLLDRALLLSSQSDGLVISGNTFDYVDNVYYVGPGQGPSVGDNFTFSGNTLTNVGGLDGIFLQNFSPYRAGTPPSPEVTVHIYWDSDNSIDGETGIRGLNELSTDATHAARPSSAATDISMVDAIPTDISTTYVDAGWTGEDRFGDPDGTGTGTVMAYAYNGFDTIQAGVDAISAGGTVNVAAGTYQENVVINKIVSILGAGSGNTDSDTIVTSPLSVDYKVGVFQITATGNSGAVILLYGMQVQPIGQAGVSIGRFTESTGTSVAFLTLDNLFVIGTNNNAQTEQERGLYVDLTSTLDHLTVVDSAFNNLAYGWYLQKAVSADTSTVSNVSVTNTTFNHNNLKGLYTEKLEDANFTDCTFSENGFSATGLPSYFIPWMSGVDLNLKAGSYQNISFINPVVTNNALGGAQHGVGLAVKARDDAGYATFPATLTNVTITGGNFAGNERGIRIGEPGKVNAGITNVEIQFNRIFGNTKTYGGSDGSAYGGLVNLSPASVDAENNWWGCNEGPTIDGSTECDIYAGTVIVDPWLILQATIPAGDYMPGHTYTVEGDMTVNSDGTDTSVIGTITNWVKALFTELKGYFTPTEKNFTDGLVSSDYTPTTSGAESICVIVDNESICEERNVLYMYNMPLIMK